VKTLWSLTWREAQVQTFADAALVIAVCLVIATMLTPLLRKVSAPAEPSMDAH
jgi:DHA2 family multidrug resistance protein